MIYVCRLFFFNLFLAALGLHSCAWAFSSCGERGLLFVVVWWLLLLQNMDPRRAGFSSCSTRALQHMDFSSCARAKLLRSMWDLPRPGIKPVSSALAGGFLTSTQPGKSLCADFLKSKFYLRFF